MNVNNDTTHTGHSYRDVSPPSPIEQANQANEKNTCEGTNTTRCDPRPDDHANHAIRHGTHNFVRRRVRHIPTISVRNPAVRGLPRTKNRLYACIHAFMHARMRYERPRETRTLNASGSEVPGRGAEMGRGGVESTSTVCGRVGLIGDRDWSTIGIG